MLIDLHIYYFHPSSYVRYVYYSLTKTLNSAQYCSKGIPKIRSFINPGLYPLKSRHSSTQQVRK
jgi:hypothetical protein